MTKNSVQEEKLKAQMGKPKFSLSREQVSRIVLSELSSNGLRDGNYMAFPSTDGGMDIYKVSDDLLPTTEPKEFISEKINQDGEAENIILKEWQYTGAGAETLISITGDKDEQR